MATPTGPGGAGAVRDELTSVSTAETDEPLDDDFQFVLGELLNAYKPVLEADLQRANSPDALIKEALANPPSCEDEFAQATALFDRFTSETVATRLLPAAAREILGPWSAGAGVLRICAAASSSAGCCAAGRAPSAGPSTIYTAIGAACARPSAHPCRPRRLPPSAKTSRRSSRPWRPPIGPTSTTSSPPSSSRRACPTRSSAARSIASRGRTPRSRSSTAH